MPTCSQCGSSTSGRSIDGRCPGCLLALALETSPDDDGRILNPPPPLLALPSDFGEFTLLEELGRGGMGVVYRARQKRLNRDVALKLLLAGPYADPENRRRFLEESTFAAGLHHPHLVKLFDAGEHAGTAWCAMELIEGGDLEHALARHALAPRELAGLMAAVARAVAHAHERGVVHRDLKPSNILIDANGDPHVADFGLARRFGDGASLTVSGRLLGTPAFWPPDQLEADAAAGPSGDIYALGAIIYTGLTGRPPFQADSLEALLLQVVSNDPIPPRRLNPDVPRDLETIALKCLEKNPAQRYASARQLADELDRHLSGEPIQARPAGPGLRLWKWARRKPALAAAVMLLVTTVSVGLTVSLSQWRRAEQHARQLAETVLRLRYDRADARLHDGATAEGLALLAELSREHPDHHVANYRLLETLGRRGFIVPLPWTATNDTFRFTSAFTVAADHLVTARNNARELTVWSTRDGIKRVGEITVETPVRVTAIDSDERLLAAATQDGRLFAYDLRTLARVADPRSFEGIPEEVFFIPEERHVVVLSVPDLKSDNYRRRRGTIIDLDTGERPHPDIRFHDVAFSPDGRRLATLLEYTITLRTRADWSPLAPAVSEPAHVNEVEFTPDSKRFLTASGANNASVWDAETGRLIRKLAHPVNVQEVVISPADDIAVTIDNGRQGRFWNLTTYRQIGPVFAATKGFARTAFSADGRWFLTHAESGLRIFDPGTGRALSEEFNPNTIITASAFLDGGPRIVTASIDGSARLWNFLEPARKPVVMRDNLEVEYAAVSPDGRRIAAGIKGSWARIWNAASGTEAGPWLKHDRSVRRVHWSPDGRRLVTASRDRTAQIWDATTHERIGEPMHHEGPVWDARFSPDGRWIVTASEDGSARIWNATDGSPVTAALRHDGPVAGAAFRPGRDQVATFSRDQTVRLWSVPSGRAAGEPFEHEAEVGGVAFDPEGNLMAVHGGGEQVQVWRVDEHQLAFPPIRHAGIVHGADFSPDGLRLVTGSVDDTARIWSTVDGRPLSRPLRHKADVRWVSFSPNGKMVLTTSDDGTARIWDVETGQPLASPFQHDNRVVVGRWLPDGSGVVTASYDRTVRLWPLPAAPAGPAPSWLADLAESRGGARLTREDVLVPVPPEQVLQRQATIEQSGEDGPWARERSRLTTR